MDHYTEGKTFDKENFTDGVLAKGEYENCVFTSCGLSNISLAGTKFITCQFIDCNLSLAKFSNTSFQDATFKGCKMLGLHFENCNEFGLALRFENCNLSHSSFYNVKLKKTIFKDLVLHEADFTGSDLTASTFDNCDLLNAHFERTVLEKADLKTSFNYSLDPEINRIKKTRFSREGVTGLLTKYDIIIS